MAKLLTVLLVDDDKSGRAMLRLSLKQAGYEMLTAADGPEALQLLKQTHCDALVTDARMKPMDGFELSREAKKLRPAIRIAMMSAICSQADIAGYPIETCFSKPVPMESLLGWLSAGKGRAP
jgi:CheY-like chemotaxis protein